MATQIHTSSVQVSPPSHPHPPSGCNVCSAKRVLTTLVYRSSGQWQDKFLDVSDGCTGEWIPDSHTYSAVKPVMTMESFTVSEHAGPKQTTPINNSKWLPPLCSPDKLVTPYLHLRQVESGVGHCLLLHCSDAVDKTWRWLHAHRLPLAALFDLV